MAPWALGNSAIHHSPAVLLNEEREFVALGAESPDCGHLGIGHQAGIAHHVRTQDRRKPVNDAVRFH